MSPKSTFDDAGLTYLFRSFALASLRTRMRLGNRNKSMTVKIIAVGWDLSFGDGDHCDADLVTGKAYNLLIDAIHPVASGWPVHKC